MNLLLLVSLAAIYCLPASGHQLQNVLCQLKPTVIATDDPSFAHYPYFVTLHRCTGSWGRTNPSIVQCVPSHTKNVEVTTYRIDGHNPPLAETITLVNHTKCTSECVVKATQCSKYEAYDKANCRCHCPHTVAPIRCPPRMMWDSQRCECACVSRVGSCPANKIWLDSSCSCGCPAKQVKRCRRNGKVLDTRTCSCVSNRMLRLDDAMKSAKIGGSTSESKTTFWYYIVIGEFFVMLLICDAILYRKKTGMAYKLSSAAWRSDSIDISKPEVVVVSGKDNALSCSSQTSLASSTQQETRALLSGTPTQSMEHL